VRWLVVPAGAGEFDLLMSYVQKRAMVQPTVENEDKLRVHVVWDDGASRVVGNAAAQDCGIPGILGSRVSDSP